MNDLTDYYGGLDIQQSPPPDHTGKLIAALICITLLIIGICLN